MQDALIIGYVMYALNNLIQQRDTRRPFVIGRNHRPRHILDRGGVGMVK